MPGKLAIVNINTFRCIGCSVCVQSCPNDVIRMRKGKAYIAYQDDCSACFACETDCPSEAICLGLTNSTLTEMNCAGN